METSVCRLLPVQFQVTVRENASRLLYWDRKHCAPLIALTTHQTRLHRQTCHVPPWCKGSLIFFIAVRTSCKTKSDFCWNYRHAVTEVRYVPVCSLRNSCIACAVSHEGVTMRWRCWMKRSWWVLRKRWDLTDCPAPVSCLGMEAGGSGLGVRRSANSACSFAKCLRKWPYFGRAFLEFCQLKWCIMYRSLTVLRNIVWLTKTRKLPEAPFFVSFFFHFLWYLFLFQPFNWHINVCATLFLHHKKQAPNYSYLS